MDSELDHVTRSLFAQLRRDRAEIAENSSDFDILICPKCSDRLEPLVMPATVDAKTNQKSQTIWWTCRGLNTKTCIFPLDMPAKVFWTQRSVVQMRDGLLPLPNIHLLPAEFHYLYPTYFGGAKRPTKGLNPISAESYEEDVSVNAKSAGNNDNHRGEVNKNPANSQAPRRAINENFDVQMKTANSDIRYGSVDSRRNVELFADTNSALNSMIALKYRTESFLSNINSEMSRKQLVKPAPAISSQQRRRLSYMMQRYRTKHGGAAPPLNVIEAMERKITADMRASSPTSSLRSVLSMVNMPPEVTPAILPPAVAKLFPLEMELDEEPLEEEKPVESPPPVDPYNAKPSADENLRPTIAIEALDCQPSTSATVATSDTARALTDAGDGDRSTRASDSAKSALIEKAQKSAKKKLTPLCSFEDPEIDNVLKRNFEELRKAMFGKKKKRKVRASNAELLGRPPNQGDQVTPTKRMRGDVTSKNDESSMMVGEDDFAALHNYTQDFYSNGEMDSSYLHSTVSETGTFDPSRTATSTAFEATSFQPEFIDGDATMRHALISHFNDGEPTDYNEEMLFGLENFNAF